MKLIFSAIHKVTRFFLRLFLLLALLSFVFRRFRKKRTKKTRKPLRPTHGSDGTTYNFRINGGFPNFGSAINLTVKTDSPITSVEKNGEQLFPPQENKAQAMKETVKSKAHAAHTHLHEMDKDR